MLEISVMGTENGFGGQLRSSFRTGHEIIHEAQAVFIHFLPKTFECLLCIGQALF